MYTMLQESGFGRQINGFLSSSFVIFFSCRCQLIKIDSNYSILDHIHQVLQISEMNKTEMDK